jgi:hypothetical protein
MTNGAEIKAAKHREDRAKEDHKRRARDLVMLELNQRYRTCLCGRSKRRGQRCPHCGWQEERV